MFETDPIVTLSDADMLNAVIVGARRRIKAYKLGRPAYHVKADPGKPPPYWQIDLTGAIGELAVAKYLNLYWDMSIVEDVKQVEGDVGRYQVRSTERPDGGLIIRDPDKQVPFILAIVTDNVVRLPGWLWRSDAPYVGREFPSASAMAWLVPQRELYPITDLPDLETQWDSTSTTMNQ